jgi:hypothetical protein
MLGRAALAQEVTIGYSGLPYKATGETGTGIQLSEGVLLHAGVGAEFGYDSNVYYDPYNPISSAIIRVLPYAELTNASRNGPASTPLTFDVRAGLQYRHYTNTEVSSTYRDAWNPNAGLTLSLGGGQFGLGIADVFARIEDPPYAVHGMIITGTGSNNGGAIQRSNNQASIEGRWAPGGGRLVGTLRYTNMVDVYDGNYSYANALTQYLMMDAAWKWLPKTAIFLNVQQGWVYYFNEQAKANSKVPSYPLSITTGLRGLLTRKTMALLSIGYVNGFYSSGGSTEGFLGSTYLNLTLTTNLTELSRAVVGFRHDFINAVISNFAYQEQVYISYVQQIYGRLGLDLSGRYSYLNYQGNTVDPTQIGRVDNLFQVGATLDYFLRNWAYIGVGYSLFDNRSNKPFDSYVKHQVFARLGVNY